MFISYNTELSRSSSFKLPTASQQIKIHSAILSSFSILAFLESTAVASLFLHIPNMQLIPLDSISNNSPLILINRPYKLTQDWNLWSNYPSLTYYCTLAAWQKLPRSMALGCRACLFFSGNSHAQVTPTPPYHSFHPCALQGQAFLKVCRKLEMWFPVWFVQTPKLLLSTHGWETGSKKPNREEQRCLNILERLSPGHATACPTVTHYGPKEGMYTHISAQEVCNLLGDGILALKILKYHFTRSINSNKTLVPLSKSYRWIWRA